MSSPPKENAATATANKEAADLKGGHAPAGNKKMNFRFFVLFGKFFV